MRRMLLSYVAGLAFLFSSSAGAADATSKATLTIKGMTCGGCVAAVKLQLRKTDGVTAYDVSLEKGEAEVTYDPLKTEPEPTAKSGRLEPWEPVDAAFKGCSEGVCGMRGRNAQAVAQPGALVGQYVYCPVSGAVFQVKDTSQRVNVKGNTLYLCCEGCARLRPAPRPRTGDEGPVALKRPQCEDSSRCSWVWAWWPAVGLAAGKTPADRGRGCTWSPSLT